MQEESSFNSRLISPDSPPRFYPFEPPYKWNTYKIACPNVAPSTVVTFVGIISLLHVSNGLQWYNVYSLQISLFHAHSDVSSSLSLTICATLWIWHQCVFICEAEMCLPFQNFPQFQDFQLVFFGFKTRLENIERKSCILHCLANF